MFFFYFFGGISNTSVLEIKKDLSVLKKTEIGSSVVKIDYVYF